MLTTIPNTQGETDPNGAWLGMVRAICAEAEVARVKEASFNREGLPACQLSMSRLPTRVQSALVQVASARASISPSGGKTRRRLMRGQITTPSTPAANGPNVYIDVTYECQQCGGTLASVVGQAQGGRAAWSAESDAEGGTGAGAGAGGGSARTLRVDLRSGRPTNLVCPSIYPRVCDT